MKQPRAFLTVSAARALTLGLIAVRAKAVALMLGPEGTGLLGLLTAAQEIGAQAADAGISHSAVRQIARTAHQPARAARLRRAMAMAAVGLGALGAFVTFLLREPLSHLLTGDQAQAPAFAILALGLFLTVLFRWRQALLVGYRHLGALAGGTAFGTALAVATGVALVWLLGSEGLAWAAIMAPACGLVAVCVIGRLPRAEPAAGSPVRDWAVLARLGISLMLIAQMALVAPMVLRVWLTHAHGLAQAGLFQAAWTISAQIMAVLLMAVGVDFYPRLSALIGDRAASAGVLDRQIRLHLAAGGPALLLTVGLAPWVLTVLYTDAFSPAAPLLQGLAIGGIARLISAPLETVLTAAGRPRAVLGVGIGSLVLLIAGAIAWGPGGIGWVFAAVQLVHLARLVRVSRRLTGLGPGTADLVRMASLMAVAAILTQVPAVLAAPVAAGLALSGLIRSGQPWSAAPSPVGAAPRGTARGEEPEVPCRYRFFGLTNTAGRRCSAALNRLKVWLT